MKVKTGLVRGTDWMIPSYIHCDRTGLLPVGKLNTICCLKKYLLVNQLYLYNVLQMVFQIRVWVKQRFVPRNHLVKYVRKG